MPRIIAAPSPTAASARIPARPRPSTASGSMTLPWKRWRAITRSGSRASSAPRALAVQDVETGTDDHGNAEQGKGVRHVAPDDVADAKRPQDRGVAERSHDRELGARAQSQDDELIGERNQERGGQQQADRARRHRLPALDQ